MDSNVLCVIMGVMSFLTVCFIGIRGYLDAREDDSVDSYKREVCPVLFIGNLNNLR